MFVGIKEQLEREARRKVYYYQTESGTFERADSIAARQGLSLEQLDAQQARARANLERVIFN
jgi:hypothetical protein